MIPSATFKSPSSYIRSKLSPEKGYKPNPNNAPNVQLLTSGRARPQEAEESRSEGLKPRRNPVLLQGDMIALDHNISAATKSRSPSNSFLSDGQGKAVQRSSGWQPEPHQLGRRAGIRSKELIRLNWLAIVLFTSELPFCHFVPVCTCQVDRRGGEICLVFFASLQHLGTSLSI